ncbi:carbohydrate kinase family protein [Candidatus Bathyarchaeota archaeon]|jgi:ribokinase|nr:carbohydrate kinase family protein [Candidatus Bathyarchaeota archaeon]
MSRFDVVGFGALNLDKLFKVNKLAKAEEESFVVEYAEACGGSAANTAVGLARLGSEVGYIGKVGCDREGDVLIQDFCKEGVNTDGVVRAQQGKSGVVMGFVDKKGARALYVNPGVNDNINIDEVNPRYASQAQFLHLTSFVGEESFQTQKKLLDAIPDDTKVSFDPGALYARKGYVALEPIIRKTYVLMPNALELTILTGEISYRKGADIMINKGVKIVAVKLGSDGCYVTDGHEQHLIEPFKVDVIDTTGAGDAFCAGFLRGLVTGKSLFKCGRLGNFVASRCVMKMGARAGLPAAEDLELLS